jgi:hypothetical protein
MAEPTLNDKEALLLKVAANSRGDLQQICAELGIDDLPEVPDDIAMVAIGRGVL